MKDDLAQASKERDGLNKDLNKLTEEHKVLEGLRDHLESELRNVQVNIYTTLFTPGVICVKGSDSIKLKCPCFFPQTQLAIQTSALGRCQDSLKESQELVRNLEETVAHQREELHLGEMERRKLHNTIQELKVSSDEDLSGYIFFCRAIYNCIVNLFYDLK